MRKLLTASAAALALVAPLPGLAEAPFEPIRLPGSGRPFAVYSAALTAPERGQDVVVVRVEGSPPDERRLASQPRTRTVSPT